MIQLSQTPLTKLQLECSWWGSGDGRDCWRTSGDDLGLDRYQSGVLVCGIFHG
jgi:hypothetical protein